MADEPLTITAAASGVATDGDVIHGPIAVATISGAAASGIDGNDVMTLSRRRQSSGSPVIDNDAPELHSSPFVEPNNRRIVQIVAPHDHDGSGDDYTLTSDNNTNNNNHTDVNGIIYDGNANAIVPLVGSVSMDPTNTFHVGASGGTTGSAIEMAHAAAAGVVMASENGDHTARRVNKAWAAAASARRASLAMEDRWKNRTGRRLSTQRDLRVKRECCIPVMDPKQSFRMYWDLVVIALLLYNIIDIPIRVCFEVDPIPWSTVDVCTHYFVGLPYLCIDVGMTCCASECSPSIFVSIVSS
jgi:hypothetical protein